MMRGAYMEEVIYQECLYQEIVGEKPTIEKCGFQCTEESCKYCIETKTCETR